MQPITLIGLAGLIGLFACGENDGMGPGDGQPPVASFDYELTGDIQLSITGNNLEITAGELWQLHLQGGTNNENGGISFVYRGEAPSEGAYMLTTVVSPADLEADEFAAFVDLDPAAPQSTRFTGFQTSGEIVIGRADALGYEGTFDFAANGFMFPPGESGQNATVNFSGSFAVPR